MGDFQHDRSPEMRLPHTDAQKSAEGDACAYCFCISDNLSLFCPRSKFAKRLGDRAEAQNARQVENISYPRQAQGGFER
jgi:hypothetical protein